MNKEYRIKE